MGNIPVVGLFRIFVHYCSNSAKIIRKSLTKSDCKMAKTRIAVRLCYRSVATVSIKSFKYNNVAILVIRSYH